MYSGSERSEAQTFLNEFFDCYGQEREAVARFEEPQAGPRLVTRRRDLCLERRIGLTKLYDLMDDGAFADLRKLHHELDEAVAEAYGWPRRIAQDAAETTARLLELNRAVAAGARRYDPFRSR